MESKVAAFLKDSFIEIVIDSDFAKQFKDTFECLII